MRLKTKLVLLVLLAAVGPAAKAGDSFSYQYQNFSPPPRLIQSEGDGDEAKPERLIKNKVQDTTSYQDRVVGNNAPSLGELGEAPTPTPANPSDLPYGFSVNSNSYAFTDRNF